MATSHSISTNPRGGRPLVEDALCLRVRDLRRTGFGWLAPDLVAADGTAIRTRIEVGEGQGFGWVFVEHWPAGVRWSTIIYEVGLSSTPQHLGGRRWWFSCPVSGVRASALYLPVGGGRLASRQAHGLAFASQRQRAPVRAAVRAHRLAADLGAVEPGASPVRPKGAWRVKFDRRAAELARLVEAAGR